MFLRDVEEDEELRAGMALYKNPRQADEMSMVSDGDTVDSEDDRRLRIPMAQLLDEFEEMGIDEE